MSPFYDPMLGKLIAWGENREEARLRLLAMLDETAVGGVRTNLAFLRRVVGHRAFAEAELDTGFIPRHESELLRPAGELSDAFWQQAAECFVQSEPTPFATTMPIRRGQRSGLRFGMPAQVSLHLQCNGESHRLKVDPAAPRQNVRTPRAIRQGDALYLQWNGEWLAVRASTPSPKPRPATSITAA